MYIYNRLAAQSEEGKTQLKWIVHYIKWEMVHVQV